MQIMKKIKKIKNKEGINHKQKWIIAYKKDLLFLVMMFINDLLYFNFHNLGVLGFWGCIRLFCLPGYKIIRRNE
jgi:hypothetical protein